MRRLPLFTLALVSAALLGGCNFFNRSDDADVADVPVDGEDPAVVIEDAGEDEALPTPSQSDFADPVVPADGTVTVIAPDLIQSTNPNERAIGVQRSRPDPFASLPIPPTPPEPVVVPTASGTSPRTQTTAATQGGSAATAASPSTTPTVTRPAASSPSSGGGAAAAAAPTPSRTPVPTPSVAAANPATTLPTIPQPTVARTVRVSGVVQIGGTPYAIVQVPNEVERYVRAGERIAGGSVLVKRIDTRSVEPRVVLEQNGIEVVANVTGGGDVPDTAAAPSAPPSETSLVSTNTLTAPGL